MKQVCQTYRTGELALLDVPAPAIRPRGILVRNQASLISPGTERQIMETARKGLLGKARARPDLVRQVWRKARTEGVGPTIRAVLNRLDSPVPLGYSSAGVVIEVGEGADEFRPGDWVACAGAGYAVHAEVVFVPRNLAVKIPDVLRQDADVVGAPEDQAGAPEGRPSASGKDADVFQEAAFTTVGAVALQSVRIAEANIGEVVAVIGLGLVGLLTVQLLKAAGCRVLGMDPSQERCRLAEKVGCDATASTAAEMERLASGRISPRGVDAVVLTAATRSNEPVELAGELCREKGRVVVVGAVGMDVPRRPFYEKELDLRLSRSYGPGRYDSVYEEKGIDYPYGYVRWTERRNMAAFLDLIAQEKVHVRPLISHRFPIDRATEAYDLIASGKSDEALGIVLTYPRAEAEMPGPAVVGAFRSGGGDSRRTEPQKAGQVAIGLIGAGDFAKAVLLPGLKDTPGARLATVCTATGLSAGYVARKFGFASSTTDSRTIFDDPEIDAVLIATRHGSHGSLVLDALRAGKHVYVEKPLALDESALSEVARTAEHHRQQTLMVDYNRRFAPMAQRLRDFVAGVDEPLVMHYRVNAGPLPPNHWVRDPEEGGGRIVGEVCHFVDFLTFLAGSLPVRVHALAAPGAAGFRDDNVVITLDFANGSLGTITYVASGDSAFPKERVELFGGGKVGTIADFRRLELVEDGRKKVYRSRLRQNKGHREGLRAFIAAVRDVGPPPIPFEDMVAASLTTFRVLESLASSASPAVGAEEFLARSAG